MSRTVLAGLITAALIAAPVATVSAEQVAKPVTEDVNISGIDYTTQAGARMVLSRIERAAERVCDVRGGHKSLALLRAERACVEEAIDTAIESIATTNEKRAALTVARKG